MIECRLLRQVRPGSPVVIAVFSYRYDAHLVPELLENIRPFIHGYVAWDDSAATTEMTSEPERRNRLLAKARELGARWILAADPDERVEASLTKRLPEMLAMGEGNLWSFSMREMFTSDSYRTDGLWGVKKRILLFPAKAAEREVDTALHGSWVADQSSYRLRDAETNFYHLRMATPERRRLRRELYAAADPTRQFQTVGYDYLDDERGMVLEQIPPGREFRPAFHEDHGLWSPDPGKLGKIVADPVEACLAFVADALAKRGHAQASHVLQDLAAAHPTDTDLLPMAAMLAQAAGDMPRVTALATAVLDRTPDNGLALYLRGKTAAALGDHTGLQADLARLQALVGDCLLVQDLTADLSRPTEDFALEGARWRRWVPGPATCREGTRISAAPMSVIVIGYRAPTELAAAVASLRAQDPPCEIVVVNSGGGAVESVLAKHLDHIRLISTDLRLFVGAARNIGIDASRGKLIGFLADDCQALPGWIAGRMRDHELGAWHVSNPIVPELGASRQAQATIATLFHARGPSTPPDRASHYGRSHTRNALSLAGYYPTGLRIAEDAEHNRQLDLLAPCVWAPDVLTAHKEPPNLWRVARDHFARGKRMAAHSPFRGRPDKRTNKGQHWVTLCEWHGLIRKRFTDPEAFDSANKPRLLAIRLLVVSARYLGLLRGLARQARADRLQARVQTALATTNDPAQDLRLHADMRKAVALDPQDPGKHLQLGKLLARLGQDGSDAFRAALALDPTQPEPLAHLLAPLLAREDWSKALATAEAAAQTAPLVHQHWLAAAEVAALAGRRALAVAHAQRALGLAPALPALHARLAALYLTLGAQTAAAQRNHCADRLRARAAHTEET